MDSPQGHWLNRMWTHLQSTERANSLGLAIEVPQGTGGDVVQDLVQLGILTPDEYQPFVGV
jgi:hypothetical protein